MYEWPFYNENEFDSTVKQVYEWMDTSVSILNNKKIK